MNRKQGAQVGEQAETASQETGHFYEEFQDSIKDPPGSITLNELKSGSWRLNPEEYVEVSRRLRLRSTLTHEQLVEVIRLIQAHATLALARPMAVETS